MIATPINNDDIRRTFIPGDEWLYLKLYAGYKTIDSILIAVLPDLVIKLNDEKLIDKWFFIRYHDPSSHLRLRFHSNQNQNLFCAIPIINQSINQYVTQEIIWKVQFDTYQRELERYGFNNMDCTETIFYYDSTAIIALLGILENEQGEHKRWLLAMKMIDFILNDFDFDTNKKQELLKELSSNFKTELGYNNKNGKLHLDLKYRTHRSAINEIMDTSTETVSWINPFLSILKQKSNNIKPTIAKLLQMESNQKLEVSIKDLLNSYIHMTMNRLFTSKQRINEMVLYNFLYRYYNSLIAQQVRIEKNPMNLISK